MGGHHINKANAEDLLMHPNFRPPKLPNFLKTNLGVKPFAVVDYCTEFIAEFLSPSPKIAGEDDSFECDDLAELIRTKINSMIKNKIVEGNIK